MVFLSDEQGSRMLTLCVIDRGALVMDKNFPKEVFSDVFVTSCLNLIRGQWSDAKSQNSQVNDAQVNVIIIEQSKFESFEKAANY